MENFLTIKVTTTAEDIEDRFNTHQKLLVVFNRALTAVGGESQRDRFTLEYQGTVLDLDSRIADLAAQFGWIDGVVLDLVPRPEVV
jgi:hypothetical protein